MTRSERGLGSNSFPIPLVQYEATNYPEHFSYGYDKMVFSQGRYGLGGCFHKLLYLY